MAERSKGVRYRASIRPRQGGQNPSDLEATPLSHFSHQGPTPLAEIEADFSPIPGLTPPGDQPPFDEAIAEAGRRRRIHAQRHRQVNRALRTARGKHHERPVLLKRHLRVVFGE